MQLFSTDDAVVPQPGAGVIRVAFPLVLLAYRELGNVQQAEREMATVQDLNAKKQSEFNLSLHALLTGERKQP